MAGFIDGLIQQVLGTSPLLTISTTSAEDLASLLRVGQILQGRVIADLGGGKWVVNFNGANVVAESETPLARNVPISVEVAELSDRIAMRLIPPDAVVSAATEARTDQIVQLLSDLRVSPEPLNMQIAMQLRRFGVPVTKENVEFVARFLSQADPAARSAESAAQAADRPADGRPAEAPAGGRPDSQAVAASPDRASVEAQQGTMRRIEAAAYLLSRGVPLTHDAVAAAETHLLGGRRIGEQVQSTETALAGIVDRLPEGAKAAVLELLDTLGRLPVRLDGGDAAAQVERFVRSLGLDMESRMLQPEAPRSPQQTSAAPTPQPATPAAAGSPDAMPNPTAASGRPDAMPPATPAPEGSVDVRSEPLQNAMETPTRWATRQTAPEMPGLIKTAVDTIRPEANKEPADTPRRSSASPRGDARPARPGPEGARPRNTPLRPWTPNAPERSLKAQLLRVRAALRAQVAEAAEQPRRAAALEPALREVSALLDHTVSRQIESLDRRDGVSRLICQIAFPLDGGLSSAELRITQEEEHEPEALRQRPRRYRVDISLDMTALGRVMAQSSMEDHRIACGLGVEKEASRELLTAHLPELESGLSASGYSVAKLDCTVGPTALTPMQRGIPPSIDDLCRLNLVI